MNKMDVLSITKLNTPILRVGITNLYIVAIAISIGILSKLVTADMILGMKALFLFILIFPAIYAAIDYWRSIARVEFYEDHLKLVYSMRTVTVNYEDLEKAKISLANVSKWATVKLFLKGRRIPLVFSFLGFKTNWGSVENATDKLKEKFDNLKVSVV